MNIAWFKCCRVWPIDLNTDWGRCGHCGVRPTERLTDQEVDKRGLRDWHPGAL